MSSVTKSIQAQNSPQLLITVTKTHTSIVPPGVALPLTNELGETTGSTAYIFETVYLSLEVTTQSQPFLGSLGGQGGGIDDTNTRAPTGTPSAHTNVSLGVRPPSTNTASQHTVTKSAPNAGGTPAEASPNSDGSDGLSTGAKIGMGVGIPILLLLIGAAIFFVLRRKRQLAHGEGADTAEKMIGGDTGKPGSSTESYGAGGGSSPVHAGPAGPQSEAMLPPVGAGAVVAGGSRHVEDPDRPVSPVHPDESLLAAAPAARDRSVNESALEEDGEMQWILEEERKARERREAQGRLPTGAGGSRTP